MTSADSMMVVPVVFLLKALRTSLMASRGIWGFITLQRGFFLVIGSSGLPGSERWQGRSSQKARRLLITKQSAARTRVLGSGTAAEAGALISGGVPYWVRQMDRSASSTAPFPSASP